MYCHATHADAEKCTEIVSVDRSLLMFYSCFKAIHILQNAAIIQRKAILMRAQSL